jgi:hypothetical protein
LTQPARNKFHGDGSQQQSHQTGCNIDGSLAHHFAEWVGDNQCGPGQERYQQAAEMNPKRKGWNIPA